MELYGTDGVIIAPDPNAMLGSIRLLKAEDFKAEAEEEANVRLGV